MQRSSIRKLLEPGLWRRSVAMVACAVIAIPTTWAQSQESEIAAQKPTGSVFIRPYKPATIPPIRLNNSPRLRDLVRGGKIYLTAQDAIWLALENNIDLESERYNPLIDTWNLQRFEGGGALPGVPSGTSQAGSVTSGEGVLGAQQAAGVSSGNGSSTSSNTVGATISQIGPVTPTLDPVVQGVAAFAHKSTPQANVTASQVLNLIDDTRIYSTSINQGYLLGGQVTMSFRNSYLNENAPTNLLNPQNATSLSLSLRQNFLQGFGSAMNGRNITVAKNNLKIDDFTFETEVTGVVVNVLNLYYGLVADYEDVKAKQSALDVAQRFYEDNKKQVQIGTMAPLDVTTAEAQVASTQQDLVISQTNLEQQGVALKAALSRNGLADRLIAEAEIVPLDHIVVPEKEDLPPVKDMVATAMANRPDLKGEDLNLKNLQLTALGTKNGLLPQLAGLASTSQQGLAGDPQYVPVTNSKQFSTGTSTIPPGFVQCPPGIGPPGSFCEVPDKYFVGGLGKALGQTIRRNFPSENVGGFIAGPARNRQAQADYAIDQLNIRQSQLETRRDFNEVYVDVSNEATGLQQARVRYSAAVKNRVLEQQLLDAEQKKFSLGASTTYNVVQQQRDLATAQSSEVAALVTYSNSKISLDQILGTTLRVNNISLTDALNGHVPKPSSLPATLPQQP